MALPMLLALQLAATGEQWSLPPKFSPDLHAIHHCQGDELSDDIVVCGTGDKDRYRLKPLPQGFAKDQVPPLAQVGVGGGTVGVTTQQVMIGNVPSNRVMVSLKLPF